MTLILFIQWKAVVFLYSERWYSLIIKLATSFWRRWFWVKVEFAGNINKLVVLTFGRLVFEQLCWARWSSLYSLIDGPWRCWGLIHNNHIAQWRPAWLWFLRAHWDPCLRLAGLRPTTEMLGTALYTTFGLFGARYNRIGSFGLILCARWPHGHHRHILLFWGASFASIW